MEEVKVDRLLTTKEASEATGYHTSHFNALIRDKTLPAEKDEKGRWQIKESDINKYLASPRVKPRRAKEYIDGKAGPRPDVSLLTQLDLKEKELQKAIRERDDALNRIEDLKKHQLEAAGVHARELDELKRRYDARGRKVDRLENENDALNEKVEEHQEYLKTVLNDVLKYLMK